MHTPSHTNVCKFFCTFSTYIFSADISPEMLKRGRVFKVKVLFLVLVFVFNFSLFYSYSICIFGRHPRSESKLY